MSAFTFPLRIARALPAVALALAAGAAPAQQPAPPAAPQGQPLSAEEFQSAIVDKSVHVVTARGMNLKLRLDKDGRSMVSGAYNDVGRWHLKSDATYCIVWNKLPADERCNTVVRHEGQLAVRQPDGQLAKIEKIE